MLPVSYQPWFCILVTVVVFTLIQVRKNMPLDWLFLAALMAVTLSGAITPAEAFAGFSNNAVISIAALIALASGLRRCGVLDWFGQALLGSAKNAKSALLRMSFALVGSSAFLLNTAVVAMMAPMLVDWCRRNRVSPSQVMLPLSYITILGGVCTLIGTSTTLVVNAKLHEMAKPNANVKANIDTNVVTPEIQASIAGPSGPLDLTEVPDLPSEPSSQAQAYSLRPLSMFEIGYAGFPCAIVGVLYMLLIGRRLLPKRSDVVEDFGGHTREYLVEMIVEGHCVFVGKTVEEAGLRNLPGLFLVEIDRGDDVLSPVSREDRIFSGDRLVFSGVVSTIIDLEKIKGLVPATDTEEHLLMRKQRIRQLTEIVLSPACPLLGKAVRDAGFRRHYEAAILAVHRNGERLARKIGDIELQAGDTLLLQSRGDFTQRWGQSRDFYMVSAISGYQAVTVKQLPVALGIFAALLIWLVTASLLGFKSDSVFGNPAPLALIAVLAFVLTGCMTMSNVRSSVDLRLLFAIAGALGLATALEKSGAASMIAGSVVGSVGSNPYVLLLACYLLTSVLTEMLTNNAVAALMLPIAINVAKMNEIDGRPFIIAVSLAASLSFVTPIGYQTNLMVMGPGGYRPIDFVRVGLPLSLCMATVSMIIIPLVWPFHVQ